MVDSGCTQTLRRLLFPSLSNRDFTARSPPRRKERQEFRQAEFFPGEQEFSLSSTVICPVASNNRSHAYPLYPRSACCSKFLLIWGLLSSLEVKPARISMLLSS